MDKIKIMKYSYVKDNIGEVIELKSAFEEIKSKRYQKEIENVRNVKFKDKEKYKVLKEQLPGYCFSGTFSKRNMNSNTHYSKLVILDIDDIKSKEQLNSLQDTVCKIKNTAFCFISPGGFGLKIGVFVNSNSEHHEIAYMQVLNYYKTKLGDINFDTRTKDLARLCLVSYDPHLYMNEKCEVFKVETNLLNHKQGCKSVKVSQHTLEEGKIDFIVKQLEKYETYAEGNRNNYISALSFLANRYGINESLLKQFIIENYNLDEKEVDNCIKSAYKQIQENGVFKHDYLFSQDLYIPIDEEIYSDLPTFISSFTDLLKNQERDMAFLALLTLLSSVFHETSGAIDLDNLHPNLISFIIAPPASGKGVVSLSKHILDGVEAIFDESSENRLSKFFVSGNISTAMLYKRLSENEGKGMIFEQEGDAISTNYRSKWGDISVLVRSAYHNELLSYERKTDNEMRYVERPRFGKLVTMTPGQLGGLVKDRENGLYSRILFYFYDGPTKYRSSNPKNNKKTQIDTLINQLSNQLKEWYKEHGDKQVEFNLTENQWERFDDLWEARENNWIVRYGEKVVDVTRRLKSSSFKLMMILSMIRNVEKNVFFYNVDCSDIDFNTSIKIMDVLFYNSLRAEKPFVTHLNNSSDHYAIIKNFGKEDFTTEEYVNKSIELGLSESTAKKRLRREMNKSIVRQKHGTYHIITD